MKLLYWNASLIIVSLPTTIPIHLAVGVPVLYEDGLPVQSY